MIYELLQLPKTDRKKLVDEVTRRRHETTGKLKMQEEESLQDKSDK